MTDRRPQRTLREKAEDPVRWRTAITWAIIAWGLWAAQTDPVLAVLLMLVAVFGFQAWLGGYSWPRALGMGGRHDDAYRPDLSGGDVPA
jgi:hypothetical protein